MGGSKGDWGTIGQRAGSHPADGPRPATEQPAARHIEVECGVRWQPGVLAQWVNTPNGWHGLCAWVDVGGQLQAGMVPAARLRRLSDR